MTSQSLKTRLLGFSDLQGREALQVTLKGDWCYVGHLPGNRFNPLTGRDEDNGTTILDVSRPDAPSIVAHIPGGEPKTNCRAVQVVEDYYDGNDYLIRAHETATVWEFQIFKITDRTKPVYVSSVSETAAGPLTWPAHKGWWDRETGLYFAAASEPGFRKGGHMVIWDLANPYKPVYVSSHWLPGQKMTEPAPGPRGLSLHHPIVDMPNKRVYLGYHRGGDMVVVDIADIKNPKTVHSFHIEHEKGPHTALPISAMKCPNYTSGYGDQRDFIVFCNEANNAKWQCLEERRAVYMLDVTDWRHPIIADTFKVPDGDFCDRGGRFGPHQYAETKDGRLYSVKENNNLLFVAYFAAGLRVLDLSDPYDMKEVGYYIPRTTSTTNQRLKTVIQTNDVDIDYRGLAYLTDRAGTGLHIVEFLGR
jgi:hypothetical protein